MRPRGFAQVPDLYLSAMDFKTTFSVHLSCASLVIVRGAAAIKACEREIDSVMSRRGRHFGVGIEPGRYPIGVIYPRQADMRRGRELNPVHQHFAHHGGAA